MHKLLPSRLVAEIGGKTHANTLNGNACLDDKVAAYLNTGALPSSKPGSGPGRQVQGPPGPGPVQRQRRDGREEAPEPPADRPPVVPRP